MLIRLSLHNPTYLRSWCKHRSPANTAPFQLPAANGTNKPFRTGPPKISPQQHPAETLNAILPAPREASPGTRTNIPRKRLRAQAANLPKLIKNHGNVLPEEPRYVGGGHFPKGYGGKSLRELHVQREGMYQGGLHSIASSIPTRFEASDC